MKREQSVLMMTIGEMAQLHNVSEKALRIYHEMGILVPREVDSVTGYRYYSPFQSTQLNIVQLMKEMGFSLIDIGKLLKRPNADDLQQILFERKKLLEEEKEKLSLLQNNIDRFLQMNSFFKQNESLRNEFENNIKIEEMPARKILRFPLDSPIMYSHLSKGSLAQAWQNNLRKIKNEILYRRIPSSMILNVGDSITMADLLKRNINYSGAFIMLDSDNKVEGADFMPAGPYITMLCKEKLNSDGDIEAEGIIRLLDAAQEQGYQIAGDYFGEIMWGAPISLRNDYDMVTRLQIPIQI